MSYAIPSKSGARSAILVFSLVPLLSLSGCLSSSSSSRSAPQVHTGTFVDSPVAGLDYQGSQTQSGQTDEQGQFSYREGETISFAIGDLELGSAVGANILTPLSITPEADSADDQRVVNMLILLQSLDADGDLNNGIQISEAIREHVSQNADSIYFDQPPADFRASLATLVDELQQAGAFTDTDPRPRTVTTVANA
ncbi:hypothetical protein ACFSB1_09430, partial [Halopseudomonas phragmitis]